MARRPTCVLLPALAFLASGCAWLGGPRQVAPADTERRLSRAELVAQANAICARRARALAGLPRPREPAQEPGFLARVAALERAEAVALAGLRPPRGEEREFLRLVLASAGIAHAAERFRSAVVQDQDHDRRRALADVDRISADYDRAARRLGLACRQTV